MSEPTSEKSVINPAGNGRAKALSEEQQDIKAGEEVAKEAAAAIDEPVKKAKRKQAPAPTKAADSSGEPFNAATWLFALRANNEEALERVRDAAGEAFNAIETSNSSLLGVVSESQRKSFDFIQAQLHEQAQLFRSVNEAKSPLEAFKLQQEYAMHAFKACAEQMGELRTLWSDAAKEGMLPMGESIDKLKWWR